MSVTIGEDQCAGENLTHHLIFVRIFPFLPRIDLYQKNCLVRSVEIGIGRPPAVSHLQIVSSKGVSP